MEGIFYFYLGVLGDPRGNRLKPLVGPVCGHRVQNPLHGRLPKFTIVTRSPTCARMRKIKNFYYASNFLLCVLKVGLVENAREMISCIRNRPFSGILRHSGYVLMDSPTVYPASLDDFWCSIKKLPSRPKTVVKYSRTCSKISDARNFFKFRVCAHVGSLITLAKFGVNHWSRFWEKWAQTGPGGAQGGASWKIPTKKFEVEK